jgi:hypothetical protein
MLFFYHYLNKKCVLPFKKCRYYTYILLQHWIHEILCYSEALAMGQRRDLTADYARMNTEIALIAEEGINLLIEKGWMEQPPSATDHESLAKN